MLKTPDIFKAITCRSMDGAQLRAVCRIDVLYAAMVLSLHSFAMARHEGMACHLSYIADGSV